MSKAREAGVAHQRFGVGARPGDVQAAASDPRGYLEAQLDRAAEAVVTAPLPAGDEAVRRFMAMRRDAVAAQEADARARRERLALAAQGPLPGMEGKLDPVAPGPEDRARRVILVPEIQASFHHAFATPAGFLERLALFWTNHFAVSIRKGGIAPAHVGAFLREAIRPHVAGRFVDMLVAVETHPAMLFYLDNQRSMGPNSRAGRNRGRSLNENLAREILELHTLGVDGGYTQADVTALAQVITGWSIVPAQEAEGGRFAFRANMHEPGPKTLLGRSYPQDGQEQGLAVLADLARHPSTARHVARKLVTHFIADEAPAALVADLTQAFRHSDGDLKAVYRTLIASREAWECPLTKLRTPMEMLIAVCRATGFKPEAGPVQHWMNVMGQPVWAPPSPKGFPDAAATWMAPDAIRARLDWAMTFGQRLGGRLDAVSLGEDVFGALLTDETKTALRRAESRQQALALLIMSPEFQRR
jgi:uncharacterized protein (DUF1800 family)